jgi:hypothetical protein
MKTTWEELGALQPLILAGLGSPLRSNADGLERFDRLMWVTKVTSCNPKQPRIPNFVP